MEENVENEMGRANAKCTSIKKIRRTTKNISQNKGEVEKSGGMNTVYATSRTLQLIKNIKITRIIKYLLNLNNIIKTRINNINIILS